MPVGGSIETCTAGAGTLTVEFTLLSRLLGDPTYERLARNAVRELWSRRHSGTGLVGEGGREGEGEGEGRGGEGRGGRKEGRKGGREGREGGKGGREGRRGGR